MKKYKTIKIEKGRALEVEEAKEVTTIEYVAVAE